MWTNDDDFIGCDEYDPNDTVLYDGYWYEAELLDYQNGLVLRLLQLTHTTWILAL